MKQVGGIASRVGTSHVMSGLDDRRRERTEQFARAAADGGSVDASRDAPSLDEEGRVVAEKPGVVARIAAGRPAAVPAPLTVERGCRRSCRGS